MPRPPEDMWASRRKKPVRWGGFDEHGYEVWYQCEKCGKENYSEEEYVGGLCPVCGVLCGECCLRARGRICGSCSKRREEQGKFTEFVGARFPSDALLAKVMRKEKRMHTTVARLKDGTVVEGTLWSFRPEDDLVTITVGDSDVKVRISDCASIVTEGERVSRNSLADMDEIARARDYMRQARKSGWLKKPVPEMPWEKKER